MIERVCIGNELKFQRLFSLTKPSLDVSLKRKIAEDEAVTDANLLSDFITLTLRNGRAH